MATDVTPSRGTLRACTLKLAPGPGPWARSGLEKGSDYGLFEKCQNENLQFFIANKN